MEKIKKLLGEAIVKIKLLVGIIVAGLIVGVVAWRKHVQEERAKQDAEKELAIKKEAEEKIAAEKARIEEQRKVEQAKIDAEAKAKQAEIDAKKEKDAESLKKADSAEVKKAAAETLGLKEGKKKGRPKK